MTKENKELRAIFIKMYKTYAKHNSNTMISINNTFENGVNICVTNVNNQLDQEEQK